MFHDIPIVSDMLLLVPDHLGVTYPVFSGGMPWLDESELADVRDSASRLDAVEWFDNEVKTHEWHGGMEAFEKWLGDKPTSWKK